MPALTVRHDRSDGFELRDLALDGRPVVDRVYVAVRDAWWRTVPVAVSERHLAAVDRGFDLVVRGASTWASHPFDVELRASARDLELDVTVDVVARADFRASRIGLCVLLPVDDYAGRPARSRLDGRATDFVFPVAIPTRDHRDPHSNAFHTRFDTLHASLADGLEMTVAFDGAVFEFEDQRNWTDASYKAYNPGDWPFDVTAGDRVAHRARFSLAGRSPHAAPGPDRPGELTVADPIGELPPIGLFSGRLSPRSYRPGGGFQELNARHAEAPWRGADLVELAINGAVHAADDASVMETATMHGVIAAQAVRLVGGIPVAFAPLGFLEEPGDWRDATGDYAAEPPSWPDGATADRMTGEFGATWIIVSAAHAIPAGVHELRYLHASLAADSPAARTVERLRRLRGRRVRRVAVPSPLAALAVDSAPGTVTLALANPSPDAAAVRLPDGRRVELPGFAHLWLDLTEST